MLAPFLFCTKEDFMSTKETTLDSMHKMVEDVLTVKDISVREIELALRTFEYSESKSEDMTKLLECLHQIGCPPTLYGYIYRAILGGLFMERDTSINGQYVYCCVFEDRVKLGRSSSPEKRIRQLVSPHIGAPLRIHYVKVDDMVAQEGRLH